jgi:hypothetical protein
MALDVIYVCTCDMNIERMVMVLKVLSDLVHLF